MLCQIPEMTYIGLNHRESLTKSTAPMPRPAKMRFTYPS